MKLKTKKWNEQLNWLERLSLFLFFVEEKREEKANQLSLWMEPNPSAQKRAVSQANSTTNSLFMAGAGEANEK